jgi:hypothetical protein
LLRSPGAPALPLRSGPVRFMVPASDGKSSNSCRFWTEPAGNAYWPPGDAIGCFYAQVQGHNGSYGVYFAPWACGREGGCGSTGSIPSRRRWPQPTVTSPATSTPLANDNRAQRASPPALAAATSIRHLSDTGPRSWRSVSGWLMGVRLNGRRHSDDGRGSSRGRTEQGGHDTGTCAIRTGGVALGDGGRRGIRGAAATGCGHAA